MTNHKKLFKLRTKIRANREKLLNLAFEVDTDWGLISKLALENEKLEKEIKELKKVFN